MKWLLATMIIFVASVSQADVTGTIISTKLDENGNIEVHTVYVLDGQEVQSRYPQENGHYYWVTRYSFQNFDGMDEQGISDRIQQDVDAFAQSLIAQKFTKEQNASINLGNIVGKSFTSSTADVQVSQTKAYTVTTKGGSVEKAISPITTVPSFE